MKPQDEFAVIVAGVVTASTFQLLNSSGVVVAELGAPANTNGTNVTIGSALQLAHLDATAVDSQLIWSQNDPDGSAQSTFLRGPTRSAATLEPPMVGLDLSSNGSTSSNLYSGAPQGLSNARARVSATASTATGIGQIRLDASGTTGVTGGSIVAAANGIQPVTETLDAAAGTHVVNAAVSTQLQAGGSPRFTGDAGSALMRFGSLGPYVQATSSDVALGWTGRLYVNNRAAYVPVWFQQKDLGGSIGPFAAPTFIINGIGLNLNAGDVVQVTQVMRMARSAAGGAGQSEIVVYPGPVAMTPRLIVNELAVGEDASYTTTALFTAGATQLYVFTIVAQAVAGGSWTAIAPDCSLQVVVNGLR